MLQETVGIADIKYASTFSNFGRRGTRTAFADFVKVHIPPTDLSFLCDNFQIDHYGVFVRPFPGMLQTVNDLGYTVYAQFPSTVVAQRLKSKYPEASIDVTIWKLQRNTEKLELFIVDGLGPSKALNSEFLVEAQAINHVAFSPNVLQKSLVHRFKSIMQGSGLQQSSAGINPKECYVHDGENVQGTGVTLVYFTKSAPGNYARDVCSNVEVCMVGTYSLSHKL